MRRYFIYLLILLFFFGIFFTNTFTSAQFTSLYPTHYFQYPNFFGSRIAWAHGAIAILSEDSKQILFINPDDGSLLDQNVTLKFINSEIEVVDFFVKNNLFYLLVRNGSFPEIVVTNSSGYPGTIINLSNISLSEYFSAFIVYNDLYYFVLNDYLHQKTGIFVYNFSFYPMVNVTFNASEYSQFICDIEVVRDSLWLLKESGLLMSANFNDLNVTQTVKNITRVVYRRVGNVDFLKYTGLIYSRTEIWVGLNVYNASNSLEYFLLTSFDFGSIEYPILSYLPFTLVNYAVISFIFSLALSLYSFYMIYYVLGVFSGSLFSLIYNIDAFQRTLHELINKLRNWKNVWRELRIALKTGVPPQRYENLIISFNVLSFAALFVYSFIVVLVSLLYSLELGTSFILANLLSTMSFVISSYFIVVIFSLSYHLVKESSMRFYVTRIFLLFLVPLITSLYVLYSIYPSLEFDILVVLLIIPSLYFGKIQDSLYKIITKQKRSEIKKN